MPTRLCLEPGCPNVAHYRGRCTEHARTRNAQTDSANRRIYNSKRWKMTRSEYLFFHPLCRCGAIATDVHHRLDLAKGGEPWASGNLEALCHRCHSQVTRRAQLAR